MSENIEIEQLKERIATFENMVNELKENHNRFIQDVKSIEDQLDIWENEGLAVKNIAADNLTAKMAAMDETLKASSVRISQSLRISRYTTLSKTLGKLPGNETKIIDIANRKQEGHYSVQVFAGHSGDANALRGGWYKFYVVTSDGGVLRIHTDTIFTPKTNDRLGLRAEIIDPAHNDLVQLKVTNQWHGNLFFLTVVVEGVSEKGWLLNID